MEKFQYQAAARVRLLASMAAMALVVGCGGGNESASKADAPAPAPEAAASVGDAKIVGGSIAGQSYPFTAALLINGNQNCGGSLIAPTWVVTAAHCVQDGSTTHVRLGSNQRHSGGQVIRVAQVVVHPNANIQAGTVGSDIALIRLAQPAQGITPIQIADATPGVGTSLRLLGWGQTTPRQGADGGSEQLKQLDTSVLSASSCPFADQGDLCIRSTTSSTACFGDSGGPAVISVNGRLQLVGATSRAGGPTNVCGAYPTLYTSVPAFRSWINRYVNFNDGGDNGGGDTPCTNCTPATGNIAFGQTQYLSSFSSPAGTHKAWLVQPQGADFLMGLFYVSNAGVVLVADSSNVPQGQPLSYSGPAGTYRWAVYARNGSGSYTIYTQKP